MAKRWAQDAGEGAGREQSGLSVGALLALAYPDRVARNRGASGAFLLANAVAPMSIRRRRCRASRSWPSPSSPAPRRKAASCWRRR